MTAKENWKCVDCGCCSFNGGEDGYYYCDNCYSQTDIVDTAHEDVGIYSIRHVSRLSQNTPVGPRSQIISPGLNFESLENPGMGNSCTYPSGGDTVGFGPGTPTDFGSESLSYNAYYSEIRLRYVMGFQILLQLQCKALVEKFNVNPLIVGIVGPIWLRFLESTKIMADGWADEAILESESKFQGEAADFTPRAQFRNEPHNMLGKRAVTVWHKSLSHAIPISYSLAFSFLVCHLARENILPTDILKWAIEGKIPYFSAFIEIENQLGRPGRACPISSSQMFRPILVIPAHKLESLSASIAEKIGLQLPSVNFHGISSRFLNQLGVPVEEILTQACRIYQWSMPPELYLSTNRARTPTRICVMAILIVTIRKIFNLNGFGIWETSLSSSGNSSLLEDPMSDADIHADLSSHDALDLLKILDKKYNEQEDNTDYSMDLKKYLEYCKDVVFASTEPSPIVYDEEQLIEDFWSFYQKQQGTETRTSGMLKGPKTFNEEIESSIEDESIRLLKQDMEEHKFHYIPPRIKKVGRCSDSYLKYSRRNLGAGAFVYVAHADYYILLRACAKVVQFEIRALHCAVMEFERRLERMEERIDCCLRVGASSDDDIYEICSGEEVVEDAENE